MSRNAFNYLALLAALVVGYGVYVSNVDRDSGAADIAGMLQGYYLQDAVITQTTVAGTPHFRLAASDVTQNTQDNTVSLTNIRVDYLKQPSSAAKNEEQAQAHWVLNSDRGTALENFHKLVLQGNVQAHNLGASRAMVFDSYSLDVDMDKESARSRDAVKIDVDGSKVSGRGLYADLNREHFTLDSDVGLKLAQAERGPVAENSVVQVPESFKAKSTAYKDTILTMMEVESTSPPFIKARQLRASGPDMTNNRIELQGNVSIELPDSGSLTADKAIVSVKNRSVSQAHASMDAPGKLVEFEHRAKESNKAVKGRASSIDYDVENGKLHLQDNVWFRHESGDWTVDRLDYDLKTGEWSSSNLKGTLSPRTKKPAAPNANNP